MDPKGHSARPGPDGAPGTPGACVLIVEDDREIALLLERYLSAHNLVVDIAASASELREGAARQRPDLVLLDLGLPDEDGLTLLQYVRRRWDAPVIIVSGRGDTVERVVGLELGADDYVSKPFDFRELLARIRSVLRRNAATAPTEQPSILRFDRFELDVGRRRLRDQDGTDIPMTTGDLALLMALLRQPNKVLSRDQLMDLLHGREAGPFDRTIDVAIARLRRKIERDPSAPMLIQSVRGAGYLFAASVSHD